MSIAVVCGLQPLLCFIVSCRGAQSQVARVVSASDKVNFSAPGIAWNQTEVAVLAHSCLTIFEFVSAGHKAPISKALAARGGTGALKGKAQVGSACKHENCIRWEGSMIIAWPAVHVLSHTPSCRLLIASQVAVSVSIICHHYVSALQQLSCACIGMNHHNCHTYALATGFGGSCLLGCHVTKLG